MTEPSGAVKKNPYEETLENAVLFGNLDLLKKLLSKGQLDKTATTALGYAVSIPRQYTSEQQKAVLFGEMVDEFIKYKDALPEGAIGDAIVLAVVFNNIKLGALIKTGKFTQDDISRAGLADVKYQDGALWDSLTHACHIKDWDEEEILQAAIEEHEHKKKLKH